MDAHQRLPMYEFEHYLRAIVKESLYVLEIALIIYQDLNNNKICSYNSQRLKKVLAELRSRIYERDKCL